MTEEESITRQILTSTSASYVLHVVDGKNLERMLPLTLELIELGFPAILVINMLDEVKQEGMTIDLLGLQVELGVPVVGTNALLGEGIIHLMPIISQYLESNPILAPNSSSTKSRTTRAIQEKGAGNRRSLRRS